MHKKGWIALDIDGTITEDKYSIPVPVIDRLKSLALEGWRIAFATGRSYKFASIALAALDFPYYVLPQNGSVTLKLPELVPVEKKYIPLADLKLALKLTDEIDSECLVYAGFEEGDFGYYRPSCFSPDGLNYLDNLEQREKEKWQPVELFDSCKVDAFPLIKFFGSTAQLEGVYNRLSGLFQVTQIRDPFVNEMGILLVTASQASKGLAFARLLEREGRGEKVIAAGDDRNDLSLFDTADVTIAMPHSPDIVLKRADIIAPPTSEYGIIAALKKAIV